MKKIFHVLSVLMMAVSLFFASGAKAETYVTPSLPNIIKSLIRFGAIDIYNDDMIDIFARVNECEAYNEYFKNEFDWLKIREKLREIVREDVATYPTGYKYQTTMQLGRYDFEKKVYPFVNQESYNGVNVFSMITHNTDFCVDKDLKGFPQSYKLVLSKPVAIPSLPLSEEEGLELIQRMERKDSNSARLVYVTFNIRVVYIANLLPSVNDQAGEVDDQNKKTIVSQRIMQNTVSFDSRLDSVEFYEDEARTKLLYVYRP